MCTKFFDLKVQSAKEILTLGKKRKNFFVLFSLNRNSEALPRRYSRSKKLKKILVFCSLNRIFATVLRINNENYGSKENEATGY